MNFFTSITANYIPKARILAKSVKRHNPDALFHLVLADELPTSLKDHTDPFDSIVLIKDLNIPDLDRWAFKHSVVELCTAVKGVAFLELLKTTGAQKIVYLDPDIVVLHSLGELSSILDSHEIVLTPHLVEPEVNHEAILDNEICSLRHGVFNLGFLAIRKGDESLRFLEWWSNRLLEFCYDDIPNGLFTDQKWADLAPAFFDVHILRDKTYNVATWNLTHRRVSCDKQNRLQIEGEPLKFFHFSGFDSGAQEVMLKKYAFKNSPLFNLREWYLEQLDVEGQKEYGTMKCVYSCYSNGESISNEERKLYRIRKDLMEAFPKPAEVTEDKKCYYWWYRDNYKGKKIPEQHALAGEYEVLMALKMSRWWKIVRPIWHLVKRREGLFVG